MKDHILIYFLDPRNLEFLGAQTDIPVSKIFWLQLCNFNTQSKYITSFPLEREKLIYFKEQITTSEYKPVRSSFYILRNSNLWK